MRGRRGRIGKAIIENCGRKRQRLGQNVVGHNRDVTEHRCHKVYMFRAHAPLAIGQTETTHPRTPSLAHAFTACPHTVKPQTNTHTHTTSTHPHTTNTNTQDKHKPLHHKHTHHKHTHPHTTNAPTYPHHKNTHTHTHTLIPQTHLPTTNTHLHTTNTSTYHVFFHEGVEGAEA